MSNKTSSNIEMRFVDDLATKEVIQSKIEKITRSLSRQDILKIKFDLLMGICYSVNAFEIVPNTGIPNRLTPNQDFMAEVCRMELTRRFDVSDTNLRVTATLCHPWFSDLWNDYDVDKKTFNQTDMHQSVVNRCKSIEAAAKKLANNDLCLTEEYFREGVRLLSLLEAGGERSEESLKWRFERFKQQAKNSVFKDVDFDDIDISTLNNAQVIRLCADALEGKKPSSKSTSSKSISDAKEKLFALVKETVSVNLKDDEMLSDDAIVAEYEKLMNAHAQRVEYVKTLEEENKKLEAQLSVLLDLLAKNGININ